MDDFDIAEVETGETSIFVRRSGSGSPLLLLHGFPQTHLMWRDVAPLLATASARFIRPKPDRAPAPSSTGAAGRGNPACTANAQAKTTATPYWARRSGIRVRASTRRERGASAVA